MRLSQETVERILIAVADAKDEDGLRVHLPIDLVFSHGFLSEYLPDSMPERTFHDTRDTKH